jgi:hypothetical protein
LTKCPQAPKMNLEIDSELILNEEVPDMTDKTKTAEKIDDGWGSDWEK